MSKTLNRRLNNLEAVLGGRNEGELPTCIFIGVASGRKDAPPARDDDVIGYRAAGQRLDRQPGESLQALRARAEAVPPIGPDSIRVWTEVRRDTHEQN